MSFLRRRRNSVLFLLLLLLGPFVPFADCQATGTIQLQVKDPSGAALRASGRITGPDKNRTFTTDAAGTFNFQGLAFGKYELHIASTGFAPRTTTVNVNSTEPAAEVVRLAIAGVTSSVSAFSPTPIGPAGESLELIPVPVQTLTAKNLEDSNALDLADLMNRRLTSVYINENAENPFQPDINYRGYTV